MKSAKALPRYIRRGCVVLGCALVLLAGCSQGDTTTADEESSRETVTETVTQMPAPASTEPSPTADSARPPSEESGAESCDQAPVHNPLTGDQPIPVRFASNDNTDIGFYYTPMAGEPDPCTPLSWVELAGTNGAGKPGATAGSNRETVVLFGDGQLITEPAPILARRIDSVDRIDDSTIRVHYAFYDGPAASDRTTPGSSTFHWDGAQVTVSDNTLPLELNDTAETLELDGIR